MKTFAPSLAPTLLAAAVSCVFAIGAHAGGRDGITSFGDFDPGELPRLLDPGFRKLDRSVESQRKARGRVPPARAVRCFELGRTFRISFWNSCLASQSVDDDCGDVAVCKTSGAFALIEERKAFLCDRQRLIVPVAKWKACVKRRGPADPPPDAYCARVLTCEQTSFARFP